MTVAVGAPSSGEETEGSGNVLVGYGTGAPPARRRRVRPPAGSTTPPGAHTQTPPAHHPAADGHPGAPAREPGPAREHIAAAVRADGPVPVISPLVRRLARENGLDLRTLVGSGPDGLILRSDVEHALRSAGTPVRQPETPLAPHTPNPPRGPALTTAGTRIPLRGIRGTVADKLSRSRREIPDATCWVDADATELLHARRAMNATGGPKISCWRCSPASAPPHWPATRSSTPRSTRKPARSSASTTSTWASRHRPSAVSSSPSSGTRTRATRNR